VLIGGSGNDWVGASGSGNTLLGGGGGDMLFTNGNNNVLYGQSEGGGDTLFADGDTNVLYAQGGGTWLGVSGNGNVLFGAGGANDYLAASGNSNYFDPSSGNDAMVAASGHSGDLFVFHPGYGQDEITGFAAHIAGGTDVIDLQGYGLNFASLINTFTTQVGTDCTIDFKNGDILTLHNVQKSGLQVPDFHF
jgi:hypothetical protein